MQGLLTNSESLYESLTTLYHNSSVAFPKFLAKLKAGTLKQAHTAQAYTEASTDSLQLQDSRAVTAATLALQFNLQS